MKLLLIGLVSVSGGVASANHIHSYLLGFFIAALAVSACYWFAFRSFKYPALGLVLLICGLMAKIGVTVAGVSWGITNDLITSPLTFSLSYLFYLIVSSYVLFLIRDKRMTKALRTTGIPA
ncbi:NADH:ubiquinone oxidoreductase [Vibrio maerlii]|uniref:NADH:ubiquinone oxidoreductase n=1 Tax=Vibrio maerlii TaxID=2231648 RepID=UPI000E3E657A|nr:NADH:ubiquinone oxidoreductase [Vibrio maerlii]